MNKETHDNHEQLDSPEGYFKITNLETGEVILNEKNVIVLGTKSLFSRIFYTLGYPAETQVAWGVWGLGLGSGDGSWGTPPGASNTQEGLVDPNHVRVKLSKRQYVQKDSQGIYTPATSQTEMIEFQTIINSTLTPTLKDKQIREYGLLGGGSSTTDFLTAPFWSSSDQLITSVTMLNYKTTSPIIFPSGVSFLISWVFRF